MLGPHGNPRHESILGIIKVLQTYEHVKLRIQIQNTA